MILVLNCGSQSIKWKVFLPAQAGDKDLKVVREGKCAVFDQETFPEILAQELKKISGLKIDIVGHRVVHGKDIFREPVEITEENIEKLEALNHLAPLHNPFNVLGIKTCQEIFQGVPQIAVFDTEFFKDLPAYAYTYDLPEEITEEFGFRRYGFHGISHEYVAKKACEILEKSFNKLHPVKYRKAVISPKAKLFNRVKIITCHLGGGSSIAAIKNGKAIDTSMGFTPMQGLVMMTRAGDMDFGIVLELMRKFTIDRTSEILNKESGVKGICGEGEMLKVLEMLKNDNKKVHPESYRRAKLALDVFVYSIKKYVGAYYAILGGCDILIFTGSIGSGSAKIRNMICKDLDILNPSARLRAGTKVLAIKTDEEFAIADKIVKLI